MSNTVASNRAALVATNVTAANVLADNAVIRGDGGARGVQDSLVSIDDAGAMTGLTAITVAGPTTMNGAQIVKSSTPGAYPYNVLTTDYVVLVDTSVARTIRLPNAPTTNQVFEIKDNVGTAAANNITLTTVGGAVTIDGAVSVTLNQNWMSAKVLFNGTSYRIL